MFLFQNQGVLKNIQLLKAAPDYSVIPIPFSCLANLGLALLQKDASEQDVHNAINNQELTFYCVKCSFELSFSELEQKFNSLNEQSELSSSWKSRIV